MSVVSLRKASKLTAPVHFQGVVAALLPDGRISVDDEQGAVWVCRRAASCLLKPASGDTVLVSGPDSARAYLIAVIEQADASSSCIEAAGDVTFASTGNGRVTIASTSELRLRADKRFVLKAEEGECDIGELRLVTRSVQAAAGSVRLVGKVFETVADRIVQMARQTLRLTDEVDQVRAGHMDYKASETVRIHGHHTMVTGQELVKVDAAQIHMG
ncbi:DUF3540 domain-containing protein [Variovorax sp. R-27]|uniref:DUF3540 domain-containing protein n=1 Tax=Variovorax sp. R-27 TaxID=3404058 RepID=UPI003CEADC78